MKNVYAVKLGCRPVEYYSELHSALSRAEVALEDLPEVASQVCEYGIWNGRRSSVAKHELRA